MTARPVVTSVSHATREAGSSASSASRTASEMASATLSGWPSVTDSDVKRQRSDTGGFPTGVGEEERRPDTMLPGPGPSDDGHANENDLPRARQPVVEERRVAHDIGEPTRELLACVVRGERAQRRRRGELRVRRGHAAHDALHEGDGAGRDAQLAHAEAEQRERHE